MCVAPRWTFARLFFLLIPYIIFSYDLWIGKRWRHSKRCYVYIVLPCSCNYIRDVKPHDEVLSDANTPSLHLTFILIICYMLIVERKILFTLLYFILSSVISTLCQGSVVATSEAWREATFIMSNASLYLIILVCEKILIYVYLSIICYTYLYSLYRCLIVVTS